MSASGNPDTRPLPEGWITQYDPNYRAWFYVNTRASPPVTTWEHPFGPPPTTPPVQTQYAPPANPPPVPPGRPGPNSPPVYQQSPPYPASGYGYNNNQGAYSDYGAPSQQQGKSGKGLLGGLFGGKHHQSNSGYNSGYPPPQTVYVQQAPPKKSGIGWGGVALGAGAGLLGGVLLEEAIDHRIDEAYDAGFDNGADYGGDFGGGDFGGGDFGF